MTADYGIRATCVMCEEPIRMGEPVRANRDGTMPMHQECSLRSVLGGIGHLIDHAHFCRGVGPDAGLPPRLSALLVDTWVRYHGVEATVEMSTLPTNDGSAPS